MAYDKAVDSAKLDENLTRIANNIRITDGSKKKYTIDTLADGARGETWTRPDGAPDLDALTYGTDELYMTYDCTERIDDPHASFRISGTAYTVTIGTQSWTKAAGEEFVYTFASSDGSYPLVHIKADGNITTFTFTPYTAESGVSYDVWNNSVIERVGDVYDYGSGDEVIWVSAWLEREKVKRHYCGTDGLYSTWEYAYRLISLDVSDWETKDWNVGSLRFTWAYCHSLASLDLSDWDTSNWTVANMLSTWLGCNSLRYLNTSTWNTKNWAVTSMRFIFGQCYSLVSLDLSNWDTSNWKVSNFLYPWYYCTALQNLNISGWDTSNWKVSNITYAWTYCVNLRKLDFSGINTSNWNVADFGTALGNLNNLEYLDISGFDVSKFTSFPDFGAKLTTFICGESNYNKMTAIASLDISSCETLSKKSLAEFCKMLGTVDSEHTVTLGSFLTSKLTEAEKAEITAKGWTIS
jgi:surface protein